MPKATIPAQLASVAAAGKPKILVVDDDSASCRLLNQVLSNAGFNVTSATNGTGALESITKSPPDLLVLDFEMPGLSGPEVCERIRNDLDSGLHELPVLMLTAHNTEADEIRCWAAGANDFVSKPVSRSVLIARINTQLRLRALSAELRAQNEELSKWRHEREVDLEAARSTQQVILPTDVPDFPGWETNTIYKPMIQVGGDIFGWRPVADGSWLFWLADATGHGASAALFTTLAVVLFNSGNSILDSPGVLLERVNQRFYSVFAGHSIMSACCIIAYPNGIIRIANAGHPQVLIKRNDGSVEVVAERETMLGIHPHLSFIDSERMLAPGETAVLITDGVYSLFGSNSLRMEETAVRASLTRITGDTSLLEKLLSDLKAKSSGEPFRDDVAAISIQRLREK